MLTLCEVSAASRPSTFINALGGYTSCTYDAAGNRLVCKVQAEDQYQSVANYAGSGTDNGEDADDFWTNPGNAAGSNSSTYADYTCNGHDLSNA